MSMDSRHRCHHEMETPIASEGVPIMDSRHTTPTAADLGRARRLTRIADRDGVIRAAAIDHPENYQVLFDADLSRVTFEEVVESKLELVQRMAEHSSAVLLDPVWSCGQAIATGDLPGDCGLISGLEDLYYQPTTSPVGFAVDLQLKPGWTPAKLATLGVDAAKLVVFHRHDVDPAAAETVHATVAQVAAECHAHGLPLIVEPLWYPVAGEDLGDPVVADRRTASVLATAASFKATGADIMKVEFPVSLATEHGRQRADDAVAALAAACAGPWVLLSAGVTFDGFVDQLAVAVPHGCTGFMAGRAIWGDAVGRLDAATRAARADLVCERLDRLTEVTASAASALTPVPRATVTEVITSTWHRSDLVSGLPAH